MSDLPNPQVRQELYNGRLSQADSEKAYEHEHLTLGSDSHPFLESELISCVAGKDRLQICSDQNVKPTDSKLNATCLTTIIETDKEIYIHF